MAIFFSNVKTRLLRGETARKDSSTGFFNILLEMRPKSPFATNFTERHRGIQRGTQRKDSFSVSLCVASVVLYVPFFPDSTFRPDFYKLGRKPSSPLCLPLVGEGEI